MLALLAIDWWVIAGLVISGVVIGVVLGVLIMCLLIMSRSTDEELDAKNTLN